MEAVFIILDLLLSEVVLLVLIIRMESVLTGTTVRY